MAEPEIDRCPHMTEVYGLPKNFFVSPLLGDGLTRNIFGGGGFLPVSFFLFHKCVERIICF